MSTRSASFLTFCLVFAFLANYGAAVPAGYSCDGSLTEKNNGSLTEKNRQTVLGELLNSSTQPATYKISYSNLTEKNHKTSYSNLTEKNLKTVLGELLNSSMQPAAYKTSYAPAATAGGVRQNSYAPAATAGGVRQNSSAIYGLLQCYAGTNSSQCNECAQDAVISIPARCPNAPAAMAYFDNCFLRFDNSNFTGVLDTYHLWSMSNTNKAPGDAAVFDEAAHQLLNNLIPKALQRSSPSYAFGSNVSENTTIYGFVQCWKDISAEDCRNCLDIVLSVLQDNVKEKKGGRAVAGSCLVRYEIYRFFPATLPQPPPAPLHAPTPRPKTPQLSPPPPKTPQIPPPSLSSNDSNKQLSKLAVILSATVGSLLGVLLLLCISFLAYRRRRRRTLETGAMKETEDNLADEGVITMFDMETLKAATNNFDENLKLGEGGFGVVYKATLPNGVVAAKRLLVPSSRGKQEFVNEINLLAQIQHRNLIILLGCCTEGSHRILVYEFLPNGSLDKILFDRQKATFLNWEKRYTIILGTAKVLRYLHEESKLKIIHRDIKANNILLDEKFDAKLADFGLARLFQEDQSHVQTRVAGTYGYMAPEYAMQGQLSSKSDVYSFGILVVEIVTGKRNSEFDTEMGVSSLLGWAWSLYQEENISMMVDEVVKATGSMEEVIRCIHVALICTQVDPSLRPSMSTVLLMLSSASVTLPIPTQPAFVILNQNVERPQRSTQKNSTLTNLSPTTQHFTNATVSTSDIEPR